MALDFKPFPVPSDLPSFWDRLVALVLSLTKQTTSIKNVALGIGVNYVNHGGRGQVPEMALAQVVGKVATTAVVTVDPDFTTTNLVIYATAACTVDVLVRF